MASCPVCIRGAESRLGRKVILVTIRDLEGSAGSGCVTCSLLFQGIPSPSVQVLLRNNDALHFIIEAGMPLRVEGRGVDLEYYVHLPAPGSLIGEAAEVYHSLDAKMAADLAQAWLDSCLNSHGTCRTQVSELPSRLIDVGSPGTTEGLVRLVEQCNVTLPPHTSYSALSYCWGSKTPFRTTNATRQSRLEGFNINDLPRTYQDIVQLSRELGIRYIWIDAICIIQGCKDDWEAESAKMASIYEGAILTIAASSAEDADTGFLQVPRKSCIKGREIYSGTHRCFVRERVEHPAVVPEVGTTIDCPLLTRGWAFQERLLSVRILHFLPTELIWECRCQFWCECRGVQSDLHWKPHSLRGSQYNTLMSSPASVDHNGLWWTLVHEYSKRELSVPSDRLHAISGIAQKFQAMGQKYYLAGLWGSDFFLNLMWQRDTSSSTGYNLNTGEWNSRIGFYIQSPSWSWVATPYPIRFTPLSKPWNIPDRESHRECAKGYSHCRIHGPWYTDTKILAANAYLDGLDKRANVCCGDLLLVARVTEARIQRVDDEAYLLRRDLTFGGATLFPDRSPKDLGLVKFDRVKVIHLATIAQDAAKPYWIGLAVVPETRPCRLHYEPPQAKFESHVKYVQSLPPYPGLLGQFEIPLLTPANDSPNCIKSPPTGFPDDIPFGASVASFRRIGLVTGMQDIDSRKLPDDLRSYAGWFSLSKRELIQIL